MRWKRGFGGRYDVIARHPASGDIIYTMGNLDATVMGHTVKEYLDDGYTVDVRNRRSGRVSRELPATEIGQYHRARLIEQFENEG